MHRYRVLAADDEFWSRENLRAMLPWEEYNLEFLEPACDGEEVLERMERDRPDILLTDINMPFLSGLDLMKRLKEDWPEVVTVAVSGYDDFEKVKGAFISGGIDYLLKPVGREDLVRVLTRALGILEERESRKEQEKHRSLQDYKLSSFLEDSEYAALLTEKLYGGTVGKTRITGADSYTGLSAALVKFYDNTRVAEKYGYDTVQISWNIKNRLRELSQDGSHIIIFRYGAKMNEFILLGKSTPGNLRRFAQSVTEAFPEEEYGPLSVALRTRPETLEELGVIYRELVAALVVRPFRKCHFIAFCEDREKTSERAFPGREAEQRFEKELFGLLSSGQIGEVKKRIFETAGFASCGDGSWTYLDVKQFVGRVSNILISWAQKEQPEVRPLLEELMDDNMDYFLRCLDADSLVTTMQVALDSLRQQEDRRQTDPVSGQMEYVLQYLEQHYQENVTLASLAEEYHVDASYLSRTFSKKYGESVITCLTRIRMEKAVDLMRDPEKKLDTIAFLIGYDDYHYFSRVFRKKMGMSPSEYRSRFLEA